MMNILHALIAERLCFDQVMLIKWCSSNNHKRFGKS